MLNAEGKEKIIRLSALFRYLLARLPVKNKIRHCSFLTGQTGNRKTDLI